MRGAATRRSGRSSTLVRGKRIPSGSRSRCRLASSSTTTTSATPCTRVQYAADACPASSILGSARAKTPLLDKPLEGDVFLKTGSNKLPDLAVDLKGQIDILLIGKIDTVKGGSLRTTFESAPDAAVEQFELNLAGGKKGLLQNSKGICGSNLRATVKMVGHNAAHYDSKPLLKSSCGKAKTKKSKRNERGARR